MPGVVNYTVKLTPDEVNIGTEGYLDTSVVDGVSIQRTFGSFETVLLNGDRKISGNLNDGDTFDNQLKTLAGILGIIELTTTSTTSTTAAPTSSTSSTSTTSTTSTTTTTTTTTVAPTTTTTTTTTAAPTTTTTTTTATPTTTTTTTTTTTAAPTTTTTEAPCQRPSGLESFTLNTTNSDTDVDFTGSLVDACAAKSSTDNFSGITGQAESLVVNQTVYYGTSTDCTLVPTGHYLNSNGISYQVVYIVDGIVNSFPSCT